MMRGRFGGLGLGLGLGLVACALVVACGSSSSSSSSSGGGEPSGAPATAANGELEAWQALEPLPTPRANHCAVAARGWLVVVGGNYKPKGASDFETLDDVLVAKIQDDGTLGSWRLAGRAPGAVSSCTLATDGEDVFLVDGIFESDAISKVVRRATLSPDGALGAWQELGALPDGVRVLYSIASVSDGALRAFRAQLPDEGDAVSLLRASVSGGALSGWSETRWLTGFRGHPAYAIAQPTPARAFVFALGGYAGAESAVRADGAGAPLGEDGAPGASFEVPALPKPTAMGKAIAVDDWLFVIGGKESVFGASGRADVFAARVGADGAIGAWRSVTPLPQGRTSHAVAHHGDHLFVTGGGYDAGGLATVFSARARFPR